MLLTPHSAQHGPPQPRVVQSQVSPGLPLWSPGLSGHAFLGLRTLGESGNRGPPQGATRSSCSSGSSQRAEARLFGHTMGAVCSAVPFSIPACSPAWPIRAPGASVGISLLGPSRLLRNSVGGGFLCLQQTLSVLHPCF